MPPLAWRCRTWSVLHLPGIMYVELAEREIRVHGRHWVTHWVRCIEKIADAYGVNAAPTLQLSDCPSKASRSPWSKSRLWHSPSLNPRRLRTEGRLQEACSSRWQNKPCNRLDSGGFRRPDDALQLPNTLAQERHGKPCMLTCKLGVYVGPSSPPEGFQASKPAHKNVVPWGRPASMMKLPVLFPGNCRRASSSGTSVRVWGRSCRLHLLPAQLPGPQASGI